MQKRVIKKYVGYVVVAFTLLVFGLYLAYNPAVLEQLKTTKLSTIFFVLCLYAFMMVILILISRVLLRLSNARLSERENSLLTMYSSIVNFFGPLQSGPGFRVVYLKKKHDVSVKTYLKSNIVYYFIFAVISGLFLISGLIGLGFSLVLSIAFLVILSTFPRFVRALPILGTNKYIVDICYVAQHFRTDVIKLSLLTFTQLLAVTGVYLVELRSIDATINFWQALIYAGAANLSLFVSLTPGGLGFRESFLFFSQRLHQIDSETIVAASILDRALYVLFLGLMMLVVLLMHGKQLLNVNRSKSDQDSQK